MNNLLFTHTQSQLIKLGILFGFIVLLAGCQLAKKSDDEARVVVIENNETVLAERVKYEDQVIAIESDNLVSGKASTSFAGRDLFSPGFAAVVADPKIAEVTLTLVAQVSAPIFSGRTLEATDIRVLGNKAYVTYNVAGDTFMGAVEVYDITNAIAPVLISSAIFSDTDINGVAIQGNDLYLAGASSDDTLESPGVLKVISLSGGKLTDVVVTKDMPSFAATDVETVGDYVYVTTGADDGYVVVLNRADLTELDSFSAIDARGVDSDGVDIAVVTGTNGVSGASAKLISFDKTLGATALAEYSLSGGTIKHSKSTIEIKKKKAVLALGDGGVQVVCLTDGVVLKHIDLPIVPDLDASLAVANAVTAYKRALFMANGEAGVYVAISDNNLDSNDCLVDTLDTVGRLQLDSVLIDGDQRGQSVNHILYRNDMLFVAAGLGGVKIVHVEDLAATPDGDDSL